MRCNAHANHYVNLEQRPDASGQAFTQQHQWVKLHAAQMPLQFAPLACSLASQSCLHITNASRQGSSAMAQQTDISYCSLQSFAAGFVAL